MSQSRTVETHGAFAAEGDEPCPWCDQPISRKKFEQIRRRIQAEEQRRSKALAAEAKAEIDKARREAAAAMEEAKQAAALQVKAALENGKRAAQKELRLELNEARNSKAAAEKALSLEKDRQDKALRARLAEQREVLERDKEKAVKAELSRAFTDRQKIEEKLQSVQRQLQKRTAEELGEGAEIDLFEALKEAFPTDQIKRVKHGEPGADIIHTIRDKNRTCGLMVYDSKNRTAWRNEYARKLRDDQLAAEADYAILACRAFPTGARQLSAQDGVVLANPARVVVLAGILRDHVVQIATLRLSNHARAQKVERMYEFITSEHCAQLFDQIDSLSDALLELDVKEKKAHDSTWKQRGVLVRSVQQARGELVAQIDLIIATQTGQLREAT